MSYARSAVSPFDTALFSRTKNERIVEAQNLSQSLVHQEVRRIKKSTLSASDILDDGVTLISDNDDSRSGFPTGFMSPSARELPKKAIQTRKMKEDIAPVPELPKQLKRTTKTPSPSATVAVSSTRTSNDTGGNVQTSLFKFFASKNVSPTPTTKQKKKNITTTPPTLPAPAQPVKRTSSDRGHRRGVKRKNVSLTRSDSDNALRKMRKQNLKQKSNAEYMLTFLNGRTTPELRALRRQIHAENGMLKRTSSGRLQTRKRKRSVSGISCDAVQTQQTLDGYIGDVDDDIMHMMTYFLSLGADPNYRDEDGNDALLLALQYRRNEGLIQLLLEKGATPGYFYNADNARLSHLDIALRLRDHTHIIKLLELGSLPTTFSVPSTTSSLSSITATSSSSSRRSSSLPRRANHADNGDNVKLVNYARIRDITNIIMPYLEEGFNEAMECDDFTIMNDCLAHGLSINFVSRQNKTPLHKALESKESTLPLIRFLLEHGADVHAHPSIATFPMLRSSATALKILSLLMQHGLKPQALVTALDATEISLIEFASRYAVRRDDVLAILQQPK